MCVLLLLFLGELRCGAQLRDLRGRAVDESPCPIHLQNIRDIELTFMARFIHLLCILFFITGSFGIPVVPPNPSHPEQIPPTNPGLVSTGIPAEAKPQKFKDFANKALYYGFNTAKVGAAVGLFALVLTLTERVARWAWRTVRGSINYWQEEIKDLKNGGMDAEQLALEKDEFVNEEDGWESPVIEKRNR